MPPLASLADVELAYSLECHPRRTLPLLKTSAKLYLMVVESPLCSAKPLTLSKTLLLPRLGKLPFVIAEGSRTTLDLGCSDVLPNLQLAFLLEGSFLGRLEML
jgi:hypothetical protein